MSRRILTPEELEAEGISPRPARRVLSPQEAAAEGVPVETPKPEDEDPGILATMGHQYLRGFTKGNSDEAVGGMTSLLRRATGKDLPIEGLDAYRLGRDKERHILEATEKHWPKLSLLSNIAGDVSSDAAAAAFGVPVLSRGYQTLAGAMRGLGESTAELTPDRTTPADKARAVFDTSIGAGIGNLTPLVAKVPGVAREALGKAASAIESTPVGNRLANSALAKYFQGGVDSLQAGARSLAEPVGEAIGKAVRWPGEALDRLGLSTGRRVIMDGQGSLSGKAALADESVREAMDSGVIVPFGTTRGASNRLTKLRDSVGDDYGRIISELEGMGVKGPETQSLADKWTDRYRQEWSQSQSSKAVPQVFSDEAANVKAIAHPPPGVEGPAAERLGLSQAEGLKRNLQKAAKYGDYKETPLNEAKQEIAGDVRAAIENNVSAAAEASSNPALKKTAAEFVPVRDRLARLIPADDAAYRGAEQASKRNLLSPRDIALMAGSLAGGGAAAFGLKGAVGLPLVAGASYVARTRGPSTFAWGSRGAAKLYLDAIDKAPWVLGDVGAVIAREKTPEARLAMTQALAETYPAFAEQLEKFKEHWASGPESSGMEARRE